MWCPPEEHKLAERIMLAELSVAGRPVEAGMDTAQQRGQNGPGQGQALPLFHTLHSLF